MDEQISYEPDSIQTQEQIVLVYRYNNKLYIDGYTLNAAGKTTSIFKSADNYYEVNGEDLRDICIRIGGRDGYAKVEYREMEPKQVKQIVEFTDDELNSMFGESFLNSESSKIR